MKHFQKTFILCALVLCLALSGCNMGPSQEKANSEEEALTHFLTDLQSGDFEQVRTYLREGNPLLYLLPVGEGEEPLARENVYKQFRDKMGGMSFRITEGEFSANGMIYTAVKQYDFKEGIYTAMLDALQTQCREGGSAFADYAGWLSAGIADAEMGEEDTIRATVIKNSGSYTVDHRGYTDHDFMNLITGGFYDYADFQMAVCTGTMDGVEHRYYIAAQGDEVIAYLEEVAEEDLTGEIDDEIVAGLNEFYEQYAAEQEGIYMNVYREGDKIVTSAAIDFRTVSQTALINAGIVSGVYDSNMYNTHLSLAATVSSFEKAGMTCVVTPVYEAEKS